MPGVDGLRALAVGSVVAYHAGASWLGGGFLGVDVFLVISGYLITSLLLAERRATGGIDLRRFWLRRARRLLPAVFVMMAIVLAVMLVLHRDEVGALRGEVVASLSYVLNWYQILAEHSYFAEYARPSVLLHLWSLAVEEQFYLVWPIVMALLIGLIGRRGLAWVVAGGIVASTALAWVLYEPATDPSRVFYGTDTRAAGLLAGVALAFLWPADRLVRAGRAPARPVLDVVGFTALVALAALMVWLGEFDARLYQGGFLMVALTTAVVLAVVAHPRSRLGRGFALAPLVWLGVRSYGIYLWHWPVLMLTRGDRDVPFDGPPLVALQIGLTVALAALSFRYVETPFRRHGLAGLRGALRVPGPEGRTRRIAAGAAAAATLAVVIAVALIPAQTPRIPGITAGVIRPGAAAPAGEAPGSPAAPGAAALTPIRGPVLAVGDSVMVGAAPALRSVLGSRLSIDAAVARQFAPASEAVLAEVRARRPRAVVLHLGTNGFIPFEGLERLLDDLRATPVVVLVTVRVDKPWEGSVNDALVHAADRRDNVVLADWHAATEGRDDLLVDGVHTDPEGARLYARTIIAALRAGQAAEPPGRAPAVTARAR